MKRIQLQTALIILVINLVSFCKSSGQTYDVLHEDSMTVEMKDLQVLVDGSFSFVEDLLNQYGEFYSFAFVLHADNTIEAFGKYNEKKRVEARGEIESLKTKLRAGAKKKEFKAVALYYNDNVMDPHRAMKSTVIAVHAEHEKENGGHIFYFPYELSSARELNLFSTFSLPALKEIFPSK